MGLTKFDILDGITAGFGMSGAIALLLGGGFCLGGLTATGIIKAGELLSHAAPAYKKAMFYGAVGSGAGLFLIGAGAATSQLRDRAGEEELRRIDERMESAKSEYDRQRDRLSGCAGCKFWHGRVYEGNFLACTVHPHGKENCPDYSTTED
ncbi:MAG: hypothetical protein KME57_36335 [Scytonema hyalinum WJT4-NPBG1]|jgi:hypothetical protein|nr:hypothetical protein [Scytonema hyalinum WJT4-NPBG1]